MKKETARRLFFLLFLFSLLIACNGWFSPQPCAGAVRFAVIGDYGYASVPERDVAALVKSWSPDFIITVGDNNYPAGASATIDANIGQFYHDFIYPYKGTYGAGADINRFFPTLGNHDWGNVCSNASGANPYLSFLALPGNERYYDFVWGPVHLFALDSDCNEPDGNTSASVQAGWLSQMLADSTEPWNIVYFHHAPYSSGPHGSTGNMQWPFEQWGASAVLSGHDHDYERLLIGGIPYFVNGIGGDSIYNFGTPVPGSQVRFNGDYGAMLVDADDSSIRFEFYTRAGTLIDDYTITAGPPQSPGNLTATAASSNSISLSWTDNSIDEDGFIIERSIDGAAFSAVASVGAGVTTYTNGGLSPSTLYYYRLYATKGGVNSGYSNIASAKTKDIAATSLHIGSITVGTVAAKQGLKYGSATVLVKDNLGNPVGGSVVTGHFSGTFTDKLAATTGTDGRALFKSAKAAKKPKFTFCVDNVTHPTLSYDPGANVLTCAGM